MDDIYLICVSAWSKISQIAYYVTKGTYFCLKIPLSIRETLPLINSKFEIILKEINELLTNEFLRFRIHISKHFYGFNLIKLVDSIFLLFSCGVIFSFLCFFFKSNFSMFAKTHFIVYFCVLSLTYTRGQKMNFNEWITRCHPKSCHYHSKIYFFHSTLDEPCLLMKYHIMHL